MEANKTYRIIIGGGGTGGHVFPAISIADALGRRLEGCSFLFVGALGKLEMEKVPAAGYEIIGLPVAGFQRRLTWKNVSFFFKLLRSTMRARKIISDFKPDVVIGVGGYASGPIGRAAARKKIPLLIQEQNSYAGITNRILARSARKICVAYQGMEKYFPAGKIVLTGNPIRQHLAMDETESAASHAVFGLQQGKETLLLIGGSLGARTLNESIIQNFSTLIDSGVQLIWQTGKYYYKSILETMKGQENDRIKIVPFISEMDRAFQVADVIISRAGAGTISELCVIGKPVILVPSPNVAEDHQTQNARALSDQDAGMLITDADARETLVDEALKLIRDSERKQLLSENIKKLAIEDAGDRIANEVIEILGE